MRYQLCYRYNVQFLLFSSYLMSQEEFLTRDFRDEIEMEREGQTETRILKVRKDDAEEHHQDDNDGKMIVNSRIITTMIRGEERRASVPLTRDEMILDGDFPSPPLVASELSSTRRVESFLQSPLYLFELNYCRFYCWKSR